MAHRALLPSRFGPTNLFLQLKVATREFLGRGSAKRVVRRLARLSVLRAVLRTILRAVLRVVVRVPLIAFRPIYLLLLIAALAGVVAR